MRFDARDMQHPEGDSAAPEEDPVAKGGAVTGELLLLSSVSVSFFAAVAAAVAFCSLADVLSAATAKETRSQREKRSSTPRIRERPHAEVPFFLLGCSISFFQIRFFHPS